MFVLNYSTSMESDHSLKLVIIITILKGCDLKPSELKLKFIVDPQVLYFISPVPSTKRKTSPIEPKCSLIAALAHNVI
jgi:hypothetical protein